jgi:hypothetical protein
VALLYLVVNELLVEARETLAGKEYWRTVMDLGIYLVKVTCGAFGSLFLVPLSNLGTFLCTQLKFL